MFIKIQKLADLETVFGEKTKEIWKLIKEETGSKQRKPRFVYVFSGNEAPEIHANDYDCCMRIAVNLKTGIRDSIAVPTGENAINAGKTLGVVANIPEDFALIDVLWNDYCRTMSLTVTSPNVQKQLENNN